MIDRVLVVGGTGMLGHKLVQVLAGDPQLDVHATVRTAPNPVFAAKGATYHAGVDLAGGSTPLERVVEVVQPVFVINAIGAIKQKDLRSSIDDTFFLNGSLPHLIPLLRSSGDIKVIHFSTDCVFKGDRGGYTEQHLPDVEDLYGRSKACGEIGYGRHLTLRTSIVGFELAGHLGLFSWFLRQPRGSTLRGFTRAIYSGLPTVTLSRTVLEIIRSRPELSGVYHVASEPIDKYELLSRLNETLDLGHVLVPDDTFRIDRSLDDTRFRTLTGTSRPVWGELMEEIAADYRSLPYDRVYRMPAHF